MNKMNLLSLRVLSCVAVAPTPPHTPPIHSSQITHNGAAKPKPMTEQMTTTSMGKTVPPPNSTANMNKLLGRNFILRTFVCGRYVACALDRLDFEFILPILFFAEISRARNLLETREGNLTFLIQLNIDHPNVIFLPPRHKLSCIEIG